ncbi:MAG: flagellar assembly protein FliH [Sulfurimonadaceae bacterium]|jgi:flagellar assembly protein FliH|nr:flagellar assembly protein FliH [Sulfurimonadaceae bacterium]
MATVISNEKLAKHRIDKYTFKVLAVGGQQGATNQSQNESIFATEPQTQIDETPRETPSAQKDNLAESLLKQVDEVTSNFIKLQMKLESKEEEFKKELQQAKEVAFAEGQIKGKEEAGKESEQKYADGLGQFATSIESLEQTAEQFHASLEGIKNELITAALDISKEVIKVELSENSDMVAKMLASELIEDLQNASKVRLKVNPKNFTALSEKMAQLKHIEVVADKAISEGGVIALSDVGNIDAQISKRFEKVKKAVLSD